MKVHEILNEAESPKTMSSWIARLEKAGGKVYAEITKGADKGFLGVNGSGKSKVYFAMYPDGSQQRFEKPIEAKDLKSGWTVAGGDLRDPESIKKDKARQEKLRKAAEREELFTKKIQIPTDEELIKICKASGIDLGKIEDAYPESLYSRDPYDFKEIDGREVATVEYCIHIKNEDYTEDGENGPEIHDPVRIEFWRDPKNPEKIHADQI